MIIGGNGLCVFHRQQGKKVKRLLIKSGSINQSTHTCCVIVVLIKSGSINQSTHTFRVIAVLGVGALLGGRRWKKTQRRTHGSSGIVSFSTFHISLWFCTILKQKNAIHCAWEITRYFSPVTTARTSVFLPFEITSQFQLRHYGWFQVVYYYGRGTSKGGRRSAQPAGTECGHLQR